MKKLTIEEENLLHKDLCSRLPYGVICKCYHMECNEWDGKPFIATYNLSMYNIDINGMVFADGFDFEIDEVRPYLRPMSSMTEEEKKELLCTIVGKNAAKYFQVLPDGSIDNTDAAHQDLHNFTMHWINFDGSNTTSYIDWLNAHHFDYRGLIKKGLALEAPKDIYVN